MAKKVTNSSKTIETLIHDEAKRKNIPTAEFQSVLQKEAQDPLKVTLPRDAAGLTEEKENRNRDLDPQLVWRGKDEQDWSDLVVNAPPIYIQEKVHPKVLIDDLLRRTASDKQAAETQTDLFADFNGIPTEAAKTDFYQHDQNWSNRMILGDSLQVMASLAEREGLRGKVQCIYFDPPYGIKFNSNFQWSTTSRDVKDGNVDHITREPEQVKAFRDTWRDGIHSYLTYLRDRLTVARDLLTESGSIFVQIGDENLGRIKELLNEIFGEDNYIITIPFQKKAYQEANALAPVNDYLLWAAKSKRSMKFRALYMPTPFEGDVGKYTRIESPDLILDTSNDKEEADIESLIVKGWRLVREDYPVVSQDPPKSPQQFEYQGIVYEPPSNRHWSQKYPDGMQRLAIAGRLRGTGSRLYAREYWTDSAIVPRNNLWTKLKGPANPNYVVETATEVVKRCLLMVTDCGDLVLDPTCGSGTTAYVAEQWGRRWITIDTSRVALALARARVMGARYPYYLLADEVESVQDLVASNGKDIRYKPLSTSHQSLKQGFVYERVPHITLKAIANNAEIDVIWEKWQEKIAPLLEKLAAVVNKKESTAKSPSTSLAEWEVPRDYPEKWPAEAKKHHADFWQARIARQREIDASIAAKAEYEYLYDKPYEDKKKVRVAGPFTVESLLPHRVLGVDENDNLIDGLKDPKSNYGTVRDFTQIILENLKIAGVQQAHKEDKIVFTSLTPWPGYYICAEGRFEGSGELLVKSGKQNADQLTTKHSPLVTKENRAAIFVGPEFGTVSRPDLVAAAREAGDADFDVLITCAFNYDAHSSEFNKLGRIPVLKARMNADLHMAEDLKNTGKGNLFVIFGEPDIEVVSGEWLVTSNGRMVAHYDSVKRLSGLGSLEEINRLGRDHLSYFRELSTGREIRFDQSGKKSGGIGSGKHSGGSGSDRDGRVSPVSERGERIAGGSGNSADTGLQIEAGAGERGAEASGRSSGNQQDAWRSKTITALKDLTKSDFPLSLTTNHYSQVTILGVDVFHPNTGEVRSDGAEGIACWFIDTDYNEESFFVRHAYFLGANDPYKALKTTLKAEINQEAWATLNSDISRPFDKPKSNRIAVKVINHLGDEVMKVFRA